MSKLTIDIQFPDWEARLVAAEDRINRFIAAGVQTNRGMLFDSEGAYNGHEKWAPLKYREGQILSLTGTLRRSLSPQRKDGTAGEGGFVETTGSLVRKTTVVGTRVAYAAMMNYGTTGLPNGVLTPKTKSVLVFNVGGKKVFAKSVKIPARPFDQWNKADAEDLEAGLVQLITEILNGN